MSAWAGINYFACHHAEPSNTDASRVLTWPEGNGRLVKLLKKSLSNEQLHSNCMVKNVSIQNNKVELTIFNYKLNKSFLVKANKCVLAVPPFVAAKIIDKNIPYPFDKVSKLKHAPWMVAAITLDNIPESRGIELCWDNVCYGQRSLGYIYNQHQTLKQGSDKMVISLYMTFNDIDDKKSRNTIRNYTEADWEKIVINELEQMHHGISALVEEIEIFTWGHGMILPCKDLVKSSALKELGKPIDNKLFFAHSDLAGYSTFEEAFDLGHKAGIDLSSTL